MRFSNHLDMEGVIRISNLPAPGAPADAVRKQDLDSAIEGLSPKDSCRVATQGNISLASPGASVDGIALVSGDRVLVKNQTTAAENGIYVFTGAATPMTRAADGSTSSELEQAVVSVEEGTDASTTWRQTSVNFVLDTGAVTWVPFGTATPPASSSTAGIAAFATQAEVDAGVVTNKIVTPAGLAGNSNRKLKFAQDIGDGTSTQFDLVHNFNTRDVEAFIYRNATPWDTVLADVSRPDANTVRINFAVAPAANAFRAVVLG